MSSSALPQLSDPGPDRRPEAGNVRHGHEAAHEAVRQFGLNLAHGVPAARVRLGVNRVLQTWDLVHLAEDVLLVVTELVQNVTQHTVDGCELHLAVVQDDIVVEVIDADPRPPVMRAHDPRGLGGRGLIIVAAIARRWGWRPATWAGHTGKAVWVELALYPDGGRREP